MQKFLIPAARMLTFMTLLLGLGYPVVVFLGSQLLFKENAEGALLRREGKVIGSHWIAQKFTQPQYFWPRPSAIDYNPLPSGGSNLSPDSQTLKTQVAERETQLAAGQAVPEDLLFASASGLDPEISPQAAQFQVARVAQARGIDPQKLKTLVKRFTLGRQWGFLGEPRVNVLELNLALDTNGAP